MIDPPKVAAARIDVARAKGALRDTIGQLMERFQPHNLVDDIWEQAKNKGADLAEDAVDAVRKRPVAAGGIVAAVAMFLAREPIKDAARRITDAMTSDDDNDVEPGPEKPVASPARRRAPRRATRKTEKVK